MFFRTMFLFLIAKRRPPLHIHDVGKARFRVWPTDIDVLNHLNNGVYLSIMDLGRMDLLIRAGAWAKLSKLKYYPVVVSETISFRKSLRPWQRFFVETKVSGYDDKAVYVEQRFVVDGEIYAQAFIRGRFIKRSGGTVRIEELADALGIDTAELTLPRWLERWSNDVALPPSRSAAPSTWSE